MTDSGRERPGGRGLSESCCEGPAGRVSVSEEQPKKPRAWVLWRMDDNGSRYRVSTHPSEAEARAAARTFEARAHKQHYWVERESS